METAPLSGNIRRAKTPSRPIQRDVFRDRLAPQPSIPAFLLPDYVVGPAYVLTEYISRGGMGEVWKAKDWFTNQKLAIKVAVPSSGFFNFDEILVAEAAILKKLAGVDGVARYLSDRDQDHEKDGFYYLAMELIQGENIAKKLVPVGCFPPEKAASWGRETARILHQVHERGISHGDLTPNNIMVTDRTGQIKLIDFGVIAAYQSGQIRGEIGLGNVYYMAPELAAGDPLSPKTDIYSLGVNIFKMATGRFPFFGSFGDIQFKHLAQPVPKIPQLGPLQPIVEKCMEKNPQDRYKSAAHLADSLSVI